MKILACDLSQRRPGFALLEFNQEERTVALLGKSNVDNKLAKKARGQMLLENAEELKRWLAEKPDLVIRERGFDTQKTFNRSAASEAIWENVGVADYTLWVTTKQIFEEIPPTSIKKAVTGDGKAQKDVVAAALKDYVGEHEYACDDESDAVAAGVAYLLIKGLIDPAITFKEEVLL